MTTGEEIESASQARGIVRGSILFLRASDAIALTEAARENGARVLGVDGFRLADDTTQPLMEHSVDFSSERRGADLWTRAAVSFGVSRPICSSKLYWETEGRRLGNSFEKRKSGQSDLAALLV